MGLFDIFKRNTIVETPSQQTQTPEKILMPDDVLLQALLNEESITREHALTIPTVSGSVDFISNMIACMPIKLYKYKKGRIEEVDGDTRVKLLNGDTGDTLNAFQMKKAMVEDYLLGKGGYAFIQRNGNDVTGLFYVSDIFITAYPNYKPIYKDFYILVEGENYRPYQFIELLRNTKDGATGKGIVDEVGKAIETAYKTLTYQLGVVKTGGNKKGFLKSQTRLDQEAIDKLKKAWREMYSDNTENVVVLNNGLEFQESSNSSVEMQLDQNKKTLADEIRDIFHIHPDDFDRTFKEAIYPIVKNFETELNRKLLLESEKTKYFFGFDVKEIIKANIKERYEAYDKALSSGWKTINEVRKEENMNYIEGMNVLNVGLGAVLYDTETQTYYTPNTDTKTSSTDEAEGNQPNESLDPNIEKEGGDKNEN